MLGHPVFHKEKEADLVQYILEMESNMFGITRKFFLAFQLTKQNNVHPNPFFENKGCAERYWLHGFLKRHSNSSVRTPTGTSVARVESFNKEYVNKLFSLLENLYDQYQFPANRIFNVDETGLTIVQNKQQKVIGLKKKTSNRHTDFS